MTSPDNDLDRLLTDSYLDGIEAASLDDIRAKRAECQEAEVGLSYLRRLVQGRLDIVHTYLDRSPAEPSPDLADLVDEMPEILSTGPGRPAGPGRLPMLLSPDTEDPNLTGELDAILGVDHIGQLASLDDEALGQIASALEQFERRVSTERRALHERIDTLQAELVSRYKTGSASVDGLLS
ncbi:MAG: hypothetical protein ACLQOZ_03045 [Acidimicrobiales bacterium]|jgi:hypothetical protein